MPFTSGLIATIDGSVQDPTDYYNSWMEDNFELEEYIEFNHQITDLSNDAIGVSATAVKQTLDRVSEPSIEKKSGISISKKRKPVWRKTTLWVVQSSDLTDFVVVQNSDGTFVFDTLENALGVEVNQARFDLESIIEHFPGQWVGGFEERKARVQSGMLYGDDIEQDQDMGRPFMNSTKNMIGPIMEYRGDSLKLRISRDGFVQVVSGDYPREAYLSLIEEVMLDYLI